VGAVLAPARAAERGDTRGEQGRRQRLQGRRQRLQGRRQRLQDCRNDEGTLRKGERERERERKREREREREHCKTGKRGLHWNRRGLLSATFRV
jgi:hypothetical protein